MNTMMRRLSLALTAILAIAQLAGCADRETRDQATNKPFLVAMIPDTQNMVSYKHQSAEGFALDGGEQFLEEMRAIATWSERTGEDIAFVAAVGDVWQHQSKEMDEDHRSRGFKAAPNPYFATEIAATSQTREVEMPRAAEGYRIIAEAGIPFGVAPGNHDHDAMWSAEQFPPRMDVPREEMRIVPEILGMLHIGGLDNFRSVFGEDSEFFRDKSWYVGAFNGGGSSAQTFSAGGYLFLHIALEMQPSDEVLEWAHGIIDQHPDVPTIVSTHDYLNTQGERLANPIVDLHRVDPEQHNNAEQLWQKLLSQRDEIFLVLCGHQHGQSRRVDENINGFKVYQILADYQSRGQSAVDAGQPLDPYRHRPVGVGDGWFRLMEFDLDNDDPLLKIRTYSSHYGQYSGQLESYSQWYRRYEQPQMSDYEFLAADEFELQLDDFRQRFGKPDR